MSRLRTLAGYTSWKPSRSMSDTDQLMVYMAAVAAELYLKSPKRTEQARIEAWAAALTGGNNDAKLVKTLARAITRSRNEANALARLMLVRTKQLVRDLRDPIRLVQRALIEHGTLTGKQLTQLVVES